MRKSSEYVTARFGSMTRPVSSWFTIVILLLVLAANVIAFSGLAQRKSQTISNLARSTLFYSSEKESSVLLAKQASSLLNMRTVDVSTQSGGSEAYRLLNTKTIIIPTLTVPNLSSAKIAVGQISGDYAVNKAFGFAYSNEAPIQKGQLGIIWATLLVLLGFAYGAALSKLGVLFPILGSLVTGLAFPACKSCQFTTSAWMEFLPPLGMMFFFAAIALLGIQVQKYRIWYWFVMVGAAAILLVQPLLQLVSPKLCTLCLIVTICSVGCLFCAKRTLDEPGQPIVMLPKKPMKLAGLLSLVLISQFVAAFAIGGKATKESLASEEDFVGRRTDDLGLNGIPSDFSGIVLVTSRTCDICALVKAKLTSNRVTYRELPICRALDSSECYQPKQDIGLPMILKVFRGTVMISYFGWSNDLQDEKSLIDLLSAKEKNNETN